MPAYFPLEIFLGLARLCRLWLRYRRCVIREYISYVLLCSCHFFSRILHMHSTSVLRSCYFVVSSLFAYASSSCFGCVVSNLFFLLLSLVFHSLPSRFVYRLPLLWPAALWPHSRAVHALVSSWSLSASDGKRRR